MSIEVNQVSQTSFNSNHKIYDKARPGFPDEAVDKLVNEMLHLTPGKSRVLELASGTGKFTKSLVARGFNENGRLVAVEPSTGMIESFRSNFPNNNPPVYEASAYDMTKYIESESIDAVIIAQAFHWFATPEALKEISRVLAPGGKLALIWNHEDTDELPEDSWQIQISNNIKKFNSNVPQSQQGTWIEAFGSEKEQYFEKPLDEHHIKSKLSISKDMIWPFCNSISFITALPEEKRSKVKNLIEGIVYSDKLPASDLDENGDIIVNMKTEIFVTTKL